MCIDKQAAKERYFSSKSLTSVLMGRGGGQSYPPFKTYFQSQIYTFSGVSREQQVRGHPCKLGKFQFFTDKRRVHRINTPLPPPHQNYGLKKPHKN